MTLEVPSTQPPVNIDASRSRSRFAALDARSDWFITLGFIAVALVLFFFRLDQPPVYIYDEVYHGFTAAELVQGNRDAYMFNTEMPADAEPNTHYEWSHPAFAKLPMQIGIVLFGDTPFGWRFMEAIWGAAGVGLMYGLGRVLFNRITGVLGALLLLFEGMWFVQSRTAMNDVYLVSWIMLAFFFFALYMHNTTRRRWGWILAAGAAIGLGIATKWSALYAFGLLGLVAGLRELWLAFTYKQWRELPLSFVTLVAAFIVLPAAMYIGSYVQFFAMGHSWNDWMELQGQMFGYHWRLTATHDWASRWWTWPLLIRPVWYHVGYIDDTTITNTFANGNPAVWWAFLPAMFYAFYRWLAERVQVLGLFLAGLGFAGYLLIAATEPSWPLVTRGAFFVPVIGLVAWEALRGRTAGVALGLILLGFFGQWIPWYISPRMSFFYHMLPSVPFACLGIAYALQHLPLSRRAVWGYLALVLACFLFFYPYLSALPVPKAYANLLYWLPSWAPSGQGWWPQQ